MLSSSTTEPNLTPATSSNTAPVRQPNMLTLCRQGVRPRIVWSPDEDPAGIYLMGQRTRYIGFLRGTGTYPTTAKEDDLSVATHGSLHWIEPLGKTAFPVTTTMKRGEQNCILRVVNMTEGSLFPPSIETAQGVLILGRTEGPNWIDAVYYLQYGQWVHVTYPDGHMNQFGWYGPDEEPILETFWAGLPLPDIEKLIEDESEECHRAGLSAMIEYLAGTDASEEMWRKFCHRLTDEAAEITPTLLQKLQKLCPYPASVGVVAGFTKPTWAANRKLNEARSAAAPAPEHRTVRVGKTAQEKAKDKDPARKTNVPIAHKGPRLSEDKPGKRVETGKKNPKGSRNDKKKKG